MKLQCPPASSTYPQALFTSLGIAAILNLATIRPLISETHDTVFHWSGPASTLFLPAILDLCLTALLLSGLLMLASRPGVRSLLLLSGLTLILPSMLLSNLPHTPGWVLLRAAVGHKILILSLASFLLLCLYSSRASPRFFVNAHRLLLALLTPAAVLGALLLCDLAWFGWQARSLNLPSPLPTGTVLQPSRPRILWILLDEASHQQIYEQRAPTLQLPAFDRLAAESTIFTHALPAASQTEIAIPSLLTGQRVDRVRASADGRQFFLHQPGHTWHRFDQHDSVFEDALQLGFNTAVGGWYNPYCRILPQVLDYCFWTYDFPAENGMLPRNDLLHNMLQPWLGQTLSPEHLLGRLFHPAFADPMPAIHLADYQALAAVARRMLDDPAATFLFLHLPIPHPGGIYNRNTRQFATNHTSYLDNLALADRFLAEIRAFLEGRNQWDSSTILIMGDHSWRTSTAWSEQPGWTPEERLASHNGSFDDRPLYVVKLPGQHTAAQIDGPFEAVKTRAMLDAIMRGSIASVDDLSTWIKTPGR